MPSRVEDYQSSTAWSRWLLSDMKTRQFEAVLSTVLDSDGFSIPKATNAQPYPAGASSRRSNSAIFFTTGTSSASGWPFRRNGRGAWKSFWMHIFFVFRIVFERCFAMFLSLEVKKLRRKASLNQLSDQLLFFFQKRPKRPFFLFPQTHQKINNPQKPFFPEPQNKPNKNQHL